MADIYKFPKGRAAGPSVRRVAAQLKDSAPSSKTLARWGLGFLKVLFSMLRYALFFVMFWLRGVVVGILSFASVIFLLGWLFAWYAFPEKHAMVWGFAVISFDSFLIVWSYDAVLMLLSPDDMVRTF